MDKYDLLEAMNGIRDQYIREAAEAETAVSGQTASEERSSADSSGKKKRRPAARILRLQRWSAAAAAVLCLSILIPNLSPGAASAFQGIPLFGTYFRAVTFRTWNYQDQASDAYVESGGIMTMSVGEMVEEEEDSVSAGGAVPSSEKAADAGGACPVEAEEDGNALSSSAQDTPADYAGETDSLGGTVADQARTAVRAAASAADITEEVRQMAEDQIEIFEKSLVSETGYHTLRFLHTTVTDTEEWFCLEVYAYTGAADGFEQVTHYNINKKTGQRVTLEDYFGEQADYVEPVSQEIIRQMRAQMAEDPDVEYWLDSEEEPEYDFTRITPDQDCFFDGDGNLVISFNEGEAAPMYMGPVTFTIPPSVTDPILGRG